MVSVAVKISKIIFTIHDIKQKKFKYCSLDIYITPNIPTYFDPQVTTNRESTQRHTAWNQISHLNTRLMWCKRVKHLKCRNDFLEDLYVCWILIHWKLMFKTLHLTGTCLYVCVCVRVCMYVRVCLYYACMYVYVCIMHVCMCVWMHAFLYVRLYLYTKGVLICP
jgi:hypothetical protein